MGAQSSQLELQLQLSLTPPLFPSENQIPTPESPKGAQKLGELR